MPGLPADAVVEPARHGVVDLHVPVDAARAALLRRVIERLDQGAADTAAARRLRDEQVVEEAGSSRLVTGWNTIWITPTSLPSCSATSAFTGSAGSSSRFQVVSVISASGGGPPKGPWA